MANSFDFPVRPLRRAEYDKLVELGVFEGERIELLEGRLVYMSPIGAPHSSTIDKLNRLLVPLFDRALVRIQTRSPPRKTQSLSLTWRSYLSVTMRLITRTTPIC
jgi:hypothetical protein